MKTKGQIERVSMLWAMTECGLGGFFHAIQSPFTGLIVGGLSVIYISLIAMAAIENETLPFFNRARRIAIAIAKSLVFVLLVKVIVSPHSPLGAYFAVSVQALLGIVFYSLIPIYRIAAFLTGLFATVFSAIQKLVILWILFGTPFFEAIDDFIRTSAEKMDFISHNTDVSASFYLYIVFVSIYATGGAYIGWIAGILPTRLDKNKELLSQVTSSFQNTQSKSSYRKRGISWMPLLFVLLFALALLVNMFLVSANAALNQFLRTGIILSFWFLFLRPFIQWVIKRYATQHEESLQDRIIQINAGIPEFVAFAQFAWKATTDLSGSRISNFISLILHFGLYGK